MSKMPAEVTRFFEQRRGLFSPIMWLFLSFVIAVSLMVFLWVMPPGRHVTVAIWSSSIFLFAVGLLGVSSVYVRSVELNAQRYTEEARFWRWTLWSESFAIDELLRFTVEEAYSLGEDGAAYSVALNLKSGEKRLGMAFWKLRDAQKRCSELNEQLEQFNGQLTP